MERRQRIQIDLSERTKEQLERCREKSGAQTNVEVVRRALVLYERLLDHVQEGAKLQKVETNGNITQIELIV